jgi:hypothetical protein
MSHVTRIPFETLHDRIPVFVDLPERNAIFAILTEDYGSNLVDDLRLV